MELGHVAWEFEAMRGPRGKKRKRMVHGLGTRALCSITIGHRSSKHPRILTSNLAFHMVLREYS